MNRTLLGVSLAVAMVSATAARADDCDAPYGRYHGAAPVVAQRPPPIPIVAPQQSPHGRYEWRDVQRWVPATSTQVWVEGRCVTRRHGRRGRFEHTRCTPGHYETVTTPGRYETRQEWVWVAFPPPPVRFGATFGNGGGFTVTMR
ncbi:MAG: hypothetical protein AB1730_28240 [Myxococcota bacterium]|jgi:hypothetical protein